MKGLQVNLTVLRIVRAFLEAPNKKRSGYEIAKHCGMNRDTVYDALHRMQKAGWLVSERERLRRDVIARAPRRFYQITDKGASRARTLLQELQISEVA